MSSILAHKNESSASTTEQQVNLIGRKKLSGSPENERTREKIIYLLKTIGPCTAAELSEKLSMTAMGVRRHLSQLESERLVAHRIQQQKRGRPTHRYYLTETGDELFPRHYDRLARTLMEIIVELDGEEKLRQVIDLYRARQRKVYQRQLADLPVRERVRQLAILRDQDGYMGRSEELEDGSFLLVEDNCTLCEVAAGCLHLCDSELSLFQALLPEAKVEKLENIASGDRCCVFHIEPPAEES